MSILSIERRTLEWLMSNDTGASSREIARHMLGLPRGDAFPYAPLDRGDFGRCHRLLERIPEWRPRLPEMTRYGAEWAVIAVNWEQITSLYDTPEACHNLIRRLISFARTKKKNHA